VKVFLDTNVLISALTTRGLCAELFEGVIGEHELLICEQVLQELQRVLREKFRLPEPVIGRYLGLLRAEGRIVETADIPTIKIKDPDDIPILACAIAVNADAFVTGDKELLALGKVGNMPVIDPRGFWGLLKGGIDE
jgi:putative PIN family toxin of toxin-antitoxin system